MASWFDTARFGMFIHWGHSSQQGIELSWPLVGGNFALPGGNVEVERYHASAATFDPKAWDPRALAAQAKRMGMQYAVITSKHHDGYAMFDSAVSDYSVMRSPYGRDIVREYADAFRAEGIRIGLYYSLSDWHHVDYPAFREEDKPYRFGQWRQPTPEGWARYSDYMFAQVRELLTNYGRIDVIWFDGGWERSAAQWRSRELEQMIRELQPEIMINDRLPGAGDYATPEQFVPAHAPDRPWEVCMTMNDSWAYNPSDTAYKSARRLIHTLCEIAGKGGNLLLNVGPTGDGALPPEIAQRLDVIESWMAGHSEAILGTTAGLEPWQFYGPSTRRDDTVYLHLLMRPYEEVTVRGVPVKRVRTARVLSSGHKLEFSTRTGIIEGLGKDPAGELTIAVPEAALHQYATVIAVDIAPA
jgi:alpha-L-fucosidase